jgi:hypothetical protein
MYIMLFLATGLGVAIGYFLFYNDVVLTYEEDDDDISLCENSGCSNYPEEGSRYCSLRCSDMMHN